MASTVPARASSTARSTAWAATRPASSGRRAWGALRSSLPSTVTSASSGPSARAFAATSGPMPRGSPTVTARRGRATRSGADVDVRRAAQDLEVVLYRELLRSEEHTSELQSRLHLVCRLLLEKKKLC